MTLAAGQCTTDPVTGLAGAIFDKLVLKGTSTLGFASTAFTEGQATRNAVAAMVEACAEGIVAYVTANAVVTTNVSGGGLQRYEYELGSGLIPTSAPSSTQPLGGTIS